ncbi:lytic transglycosylase domain-containing protein [Marinobacter mobilis]|uniref:Transglycosylase SLT domain-containing protein n=1 Tax=Marinobacter mobilis TaxID=488533 RepID=A0A1H2SJH4_9GAMM|nr:lytic transglycosylase domain-containing protein [Marinobacter mobilis]SDW31199.1 Transglycosylase SLT domain-containing protein [Marinobacter mobilis]
MTIGRIPTLSILVITCLALATPVLADSIRRIVHPDGSVEYTNIAGDPEVRASTGNDTVYRYEDNHGVVAYSSNRPTDASYDVIRFHCFACNPASTVNWLTTPLYRSPYQSEIVAAARQYDVDPALVRAVIHAESAFNPRATSPKGAQGLMQLMPATASELEVSDALDAAQNIRGGVLYLSRMLDRFNNDVTLATAAYNAGPGAVDRFDGIPPYAETQAYVERVGILHRRYGDR